jgi:6-pyruvoyltetrahydropterin/6-carboxytetrahydropterin synthase
MPSAEIYKEFSMDCAHYLPNVPADHKCARMHGHTYYVKIFVQSEIDPYSGWVVDFADIKKAWAPLEARLDHFLLNEIPGLENPTAENIAIYLWNELKPTLPQLSKLEIKETPTSGVIYVGD